MRHALLLALLVTGCVEYGLEKPAEPSPGLTYPPEWESLEHTDVLHQASSQSMDVLWVVDNSGSMGGEQEALRENFLSFFTYFAQSLYTDYRLGVITTDGFDTATGQGRLQEVDGYYWVDRDTRDPVPVFQEMVNVGTQGSGAEVGLDSTYNALEIRNDRGFWRRDNPEVALHIIVVSDENDNSVMQPQMFADWLAAATPEKDFVTFSSVVGTGAEDNCTGLTVGTDYLETTHLVGGVTWPICTSDWSALLDELGVITSGLKREWMLSHNPRPETIEVRVFDDPVTFVFEGPWDGGTGDTGFVPEWTYNPVRNSITFQAYAPPPGSRIEIQYTLAVQ